MRATYSASTCGMHHMSLRHGLRSFSARRRRTVSRDDDMGESDLDESDPDDSELPDGDVREEIQQLEHRIEELAETC
jgi:hypothetical protein